MAHAEHARMTYAEYLELERSSDLEHEYVDGVVHLMAGGSPEHGRLAAAFSGALFAALGDRPCVVLSSDVRIRIEATGRSTYPDLSVVCGRLVAASDDADAVTNPTLIYVLVSQEEPRVEVFRRQGDVWALREHGPGEEIALTSVGVSVPVDPLYRNPVTS